jgi:proline iminopeptidase
MLLLPFLLIEVLNMNDSVVLSAVSDKEANKPTAFDYMYAPSEKLSEGMLKVSDIHTVYYREYGNPKGEPVFFVHGGPGGACDEDDYRYFDPKKYRIILMDQRGCGKSKPFAEIKDNCTWDVVSDINTVRDHLGVKNKMHIFGGSWGSALCMVYAIKHPKNVKSITIRGTFFGRKNDFNFFRQANAAEPDNKDKMGTNRFFPEAWKQYVDYIPENERGDMIAAYYKRITSDDPAVRIEAAKHLCAWEGSASKLYQDDGYIKSYDNAQKNLPMATMEMHYFYNGCFLGKNKSRDQNFIIENLEKVKDIPITIVHGRYDMVCPVSQGRELYDALCKIQSQKPEFHTPVAGHSARDPENTKILVATMDKLVAQAKEGFVARLDQQAMNQVKVR